MERIAVEMCYSYRQIMRFYYRGLKTIDNELNKERRIENEYYMFKYYTEEEALDMVRKDGYALR